MKNKLLLFGLFIASFCFGQQLRYNYDAAGNQIAVLVEIQLAPAGKTVPPATLQSNPIYEDVKYYPNPVKETLYMEWKTTSLKTLSNITVYNLDGVLLKSFKELDAVSNYTLSFQEYPQGVYFVEFMYNDGEQKTFKIIKD